MLMRRDHCLGEVGKLFAMLRSINAEFTLGEMGATDTCDFNLTRPNEVDYSLTNRGLKKWT